MREIKFRAWDSHYKQWLDPSQFSVSGRGDFQMFYHPKLAIDNLTAENYTLMQFTGLKDKNGKEIYEWDIVRKWNADDHPTKPNKECGTFVASWNEYTVGFGLTGKRSHIYEVIGNIYENPELISKEV